jgi:hypothetical protein
VSTGGAVGIAETHSAVVFFVGDRAYKLKKPVDLGFLDFRTREAREAVCHREVELNARLAPDVYLGVADVMGPDGEPCDHLVVMRRMPQHRRLSALVQAGEAVEGHLWHLAHLLAAFHAKAERSDAANEAAGRDAQAARWRHNTAEMLALPGSCLDSDEVRTVDALAQRYLAGRGTLFDARVADDRACDGHGDLLADDVFCLDDGPRVLDCIEFDAALRLGDGLADVAFLAMDLERLGHPELGERFLAAYREHAADTWPASLAHHYVAYRAQVRAKVAAIRASQGGEGAAEEAEGLLALAHRHLDAAVVRLVLVGGLPGTGKTTLALGLAEALGATVLRSDEVRKELAGLPADEPAGAAFAEGIYKPEATADTYREVLRRAQVALVRGETVVVDASFSAEHWRALARAVGEATDAEVAELRCTLPPDVAAERILRRLAAGGDASDATPQVSVAMASLEHPWPTSTAVDTSTSPEVAVAAALAAIRSA